MKNILIINGIELYQNYISPHKGYCCAYKHYTNKNSCSEFTKKCFMKYNTLKAFNFFIAHLQKCKRIYLANKQDTINTSNKKEKDKTSYCEECSIMPASCL